MSKQQIETALSLDVGGADPVATAKAALAGRDFDPDRVARVSVTVEQEAEQQPDTDDDSDGPGSVRARTGQHLVLATVDALGGRATPDDVADALGIPSERDKIGSALSRLVDADLAVPITGTQPYPYVINGHGQKELDRQGRDVTLQSAGVGWGGGDE